MTYFLRIVAVVGEFLLGIGLSHRVVFFVVYGHLALHDVVDFVDQIGVHQRGGHLP